MVSDLTSTSLYFQTKKKKQKTKLNTEAAAVKRFKYTAWWAKGTQEKGATVLFCVCFFVLFLLDSLILRILSSGCWGQGMGGCIYLNRLPPKKGKE